MILCHKVPASADPRSLGKNSKSACKRSEILRILLSWSGTRDLRCPNRPASDHIFGVDQFIIKTELAHDGTWPKFQSLTLLPLDHIGGKVMKSEARIFFQFIDPILSLWQQKLVVM